MPTPTSSEDKDKPLHHTPPEIPTGSHSPVTRRITRNRFNDCANFLPHYSLENNSPCRSPRIKETTKIMHYLDDKQRHPKKPRELYSSKDDENLPPSAPRRSPRIKEMMESTQKQLFDLDDEEQGHPKKPCQLYSASDKSFLSSTDFVEKACLSAMKQCSFEDGLPLGPHNTFDNLLSNLRSWAYNKSTGGGCFKNQHRIKKDWCEAWPPLPSLV